MKVKLILCALFIILVFQISYAQIPATISYQGVLKNADGTIVTDGNYTLTFNLYELETDGTAVWTERQSVSVTDGIFNVILGSKEPLNILFDKQYWLGIAVNEGSELTPRSKLTSVPYSLSTRSIPDNIVTTDKIVRSAVTPEKISPSGAVLGQSLIFNGKYVVWGAPSGTGFTLPYSDTTSSSGNALSITNSGTGGAGYFIIDNSRNTTPALYSTTNGSGAAVFGINTGNGYSGYFEISNSKNANSALYATTNGTGTAGYFNGKITATNIVESTSGGFKFPDGTVQTTAATGGEALTLPYEGTTSIKSTAFSVTNSGLGRAGYFRINNTDNYNPALLATTNGTNYAGFFQIDNSKSSSHALLAATNGTGNAGYFDGKVTATNIIESTSGGFKFPDGTVQTTAATGGEVLTLPYEGTTSSKSTAFSVTNSGLGRAGYFRINNTDNYNPALLATTNGNGNAGYFEIYNANSDTSAIYATTNGTGNAGYFQINNYKSSNYALYAATNGTGNAGYFDGKVTATNIIESTSGGFKFPDGTTQTTSASSFTLPYAGIVPSSNTLFSITNSTSGSAGHFSISDPRNINHVISVTTNGTGNAGYFQINNSNSSSPALYAITNGTGSAVYASTIIGNAVHGVSTKGYAGYFEGDVHVEGTLSKSSGSFVIDHPRDPENKVLRHSFVESPDMMNIYKGRTKLKDGEAVIKLPDYFDALNHPEGREINLTPVNGWSPLFLEGEIKNNQFLVKTIKDGNPDQEFSWIIYANRNDEYAKKNPIVVEEEKGVNNTFKKGEYIHPDVYDKN